MFIVKGDNNHENITITDYTVYKVSNVLDYKLSNYSRWDISTYQKNNLTTNYYLVIDTEYNEAFGHWVYESAIYLPLFLKLKEIFPTIKLALKASRTYKFLFTRYFKISDEDIVFKLEKDNVTFFPDPISCLNEKELTDTYKHHLLDFYKWFEYDDVDVQYAHAILPRQVKENFWGNPRSYNFSELIHSLKDSSIVINTDEIQSLTEQIEKIRSGRNIIITEGSPFLVNGIFCKNKRIYIIDAFCTLRQEHEYPKMKFIFDLIRKYNKVIYKTQKEFVSENYI